MPAATNAIALWTGGINFLVEVAVREDGAVFRRGQDKTPWGYRWSKWKRTGEVLGANARANPEETRPAGFATLSLARPNSASVTQAAKFDAAGKLRLRLPKD